MQNQAAESARRLLGMYMAQDPHLGQPPQPPGRPPENEASTTPLSTPPRLNHVQRRRSLPGQLVVNQVSANLQWEGQNNQVTGNPVQEMDPQLMSQRFVTVSSTRDAPPGSYNPSHLPPALPVLSKRKPGSHDQVEDEEGGQIEEETHPASKRQRPGSSGEADEDALMFAPMDEQPFRLLMQDPLGRFILPPSQRGPLPPVVMPFPRMSAFSIDVGASSTNRSSNLGIEDRATAITGPSCLAIQGAPTDSSTTNGVAGATGAGNVGAGPAGGSASPGTRRSGSRRRGGRGGGNGAGDNSSDGTDGDVDSDEEGDGNRRDKGKGRAQPRQRATYASYSDISNIRGNLRRLDGTMASVGNAVSTVGNALVQLADSQTMLLNSLVHNNGLPSAQQGSASSNRREVHVENFAHETELAYRAGKTKGGLKLRGFPKPRSPEQNSFADLIREVTRERMGRAHKKAPFVVEKIPSAEDIQAWEAQEHNSYACSWDDFRLDLKGTPHSEWNASVVDVFVKGFMEHRKDPTATETQVRKAFESHVKTLISSYRRDAKGVATVKAWKKARKTYERQKNMHARRLAICYEHKDLEDAAKVLMRLGVQGMSSDESEVDANNFKTYKIRVKKWRNPKLTDYLRTLDSLHRRNRTNPVTGTSQGAEVHRRKITNDTSRRGAVAGLPRCAYDADWLKDLNQHDLDHLAPTEEEFQWEHTATIKDIARSSNLSSDPPGTSYV